MITGRFWALRAESITLTATPDCVRSERLMTNCVAARGAATAVCFEVVSGVAELSVAVRVCVPRVLNVTLNCA